LIKSDNKDIFNVMNFFSQKYLTAQLISTLIRNVTRATNQIIFEWFLKYHVTLKTGVIMFVTFMHIVLYVFRKW